MSDDPWTQQTLSSVLPAYLYEEYSDDDSVRAFVDAYNSIVQNYVDAFNAINLPIYTAVQIVSALLDFIALNLYNQVRPVLSSNSLYVEGTLGTVTLGDFVPLGEEIIINDSTYMSVSDDIFKRIITWNFWRGDGPYFTIRWLKRRIMRFLIGENGTAPNIDQTYDISVSFSDDTFFINITGLTATMITGDLFGLEQPGIGPALGTITATVASNPVPPLLPILKEAIEQGVLLLPFQKSFVVNIPPS